MDLTALSRRVSESVGAEHVLNDPADCARYALCGATPNLVVTPGSIGEMSQVIAAAMSANAIVIPWGGGTRQAQGYSLTTDSEGQRPVLVARTNRLTRVVEHEPADLTIKVETGMTATAFDALVRPHGQMLPIDAPLPDHTTLGGMIAAAAAGPRRLGYGTLRDLLLGVTVVEASGRVSKAGGTVVKNVSGYDMMKLYLGSYGTLAIIVEASFKLIPRPRASATVWCAFESHTAAFDLIDVLHSSQLTPVAAEYLAQAGGVDVLGRLVNGCTMPYAVAVRAEGLPAAVERHLRDIPQFATAAGAVDAQILRDAAHDLLWARIADLPQTMEATSDEMVMRLSCLPSELARALQDAATIAERRDLPLLIDAHALSGVAYLRVSGANEALQFWHREMLARWPRLIVLAAPAAISDDLALWGSDPVGLNLMQRIKREFDPRDILNPGRFVV